MDLKRIVAACTDLLESKEEEEEDRLGQDCVEERPFG